jgi:hypothetical protein
MRVSILLSTVALMMAGVVAYGQTQDEKSDENLYSRGLLASIQEMARLKSEHDESEDNQLRTGSQDIIVYDERNGVTDGMPSVLGESRIEYLGFMQLIERYSKLREKVPVIKISPMENQGARIKTEFTFDLFEYDIETETPIWHIGDGMAVYFRYDCTEREFVVDELKLTGA